MRRSQRTTPRFPQSAVELIWFVCVYVTCPFFLRLDLFVFVCVFGSVVFNSLQRASAHLPYHPLRFSLSALPGLCDNSEKRKACPCERHIYVFDLRTVASICVCDRFLQTVCICICAKKLYYLSVLTVCRACTPARPVLPITTPAPPAPQKRTHLRTQAAETSGASKRRRGASWVFGSVSHVAVWVDVWYVILLFLLRIRLLLQTIKQNRKIDRCPKWHGREDGQAVVTATCTGCYRVNAL